MSYIIYYPTKPKGYLKFEYFWEALGHVLVGLGPRVALDSIKGKRRLHGLYNDGHRDRLGSIMGVFGAL